MFLKENENIFNEVLKIIKSNKIISYKKYKDVIEFKDLLSFVFKNDEIFYYYVSLFIVESFNDGLIENNIVDKKRKDIHSSINRAVKNISNLNIYVRRKNKLIEKDIEKLYEFILKMVKLLENSDLVKKHKIKQNNLLTYDILELKDFKIYPQIDIYQKEFELFTFNGRDYLISETFNSIRSTNSINIKTKEFSLGEKNVLVSNLCARKINIDLNLLNVFFQEYAKEHNIDIKKIDKNYIILIENHKKLIKEKDLKAVEETSKKINIYQKAILFNYLIKNEIEWCYNPIVLDFRGRVYKTSAFSITFIKELRLCIHFGEYENTFFENYIEGKTDKIINNYLYMVEEIDTKIKNKVIQRALIWSFVALAENFKNEMGKSVTLKEFIEKGIDIYSKKEIEKLEYEKKIKIISIFKTIDMLINDEKISIRPISKDATASVYQHLVKILGSDENYYRYTNLNSEDTFYDTYMYVIDEWKEKNKDSIKIMNLDNLDGYFNRKTLKKTMMTKNYGCGLDASKEYFLGTINKIYKLIGFENNKKIKKLFSNFYDFISSNLSITKENVNKITYYFRENNYDDILLKDGSKISIKYFTLEDKRIDTKIKSKRYTHMMKNQTNCIDPEKTERALLANYIHVLDSALSRDVATRIPCFIIHDCFLVGCLEVSLMIDTVNICFNSDYHENWKIKNKKNFYSIFIVI